MFILKYFKCGYSYIFLLPCLTQKVHYQIKFLQGPLQKQTKKFFPNSAYPLIIKLNPYIFISTHDNTVFTRIVAQGYYYFFTQKQGLNLPNSATLQHYLRVRYYKILHSHVYYYILNITFLLTINDNSYNSFNCLQLCNTWGSYIQGYTNAQYRWALGTVS